MYVVDQQMHTECKDVEDSKVKRWLYLVSLITWNKALINAIALYESRSEKQVF